MVKAGVDLFDCSQRRFWEPVFEDGDLNLAGWAKKLTGVASMTIGRLVSTVTCRPALDMDRKRDAILRASTNWRTGLRRANSIWWVSAAP